MNEAQDQRIEVHPCASQEGDECFPCLAIEVFRPGEKTYKTWIHLRKLGTNFPSLDDAMAAARKVEVIQVHPSGAVEWKVSGD